MAAVAVVIALAGCGSSGSSSSTVTTAATTPTTTAASAQTNPPSPAASGTVTIQNIAYHPPTLNVRVGATVTWRFDDNGVLHTVTADDGSFDSGQHGSGQFSHSFGQAGTFNYHCSIHATMTGSIVVS